MVLSLLFKGVLICFFLLFYVFQFMPLIQTVSSFIQLKELINYVQDELYGDDGFESDEAWNSAEQVFPEAETEYKTALLLKEGKAPLSVLLDGETHAGPHTSVEKLEDGDDSDDEDFDTVITCSERFSDSDDESETPAVESASLREELEALSSAGDSSAESGVEGPLSTKKTPLARRRRRTILQIDKNPSDPGKFDLKNIVHSKRRRNHVDYKKLAGELFGKDVNDQASDEDYDSDSPSSCDSSKRAVLTNKKLENAKNENATQMDMLASSGSCDSTPSLNFKNTTKEKLETLTKNKQRVVALLNSNKSRATPGSQSDTSLACSCKRSKCLKLYCVCFSREIECNDRCRCSSCKNIKRDKLESDDTEVDVVSLKQDMRLRMGSPPASLVDDQTKMTRIELSKRKGSSVHSSPLVNESKCHDQKNSRKRCCCRKSNCLKLYCYCMNQGMHCSDHCQCLNCLNRVDQILSTESISTRSQRNKSSSSNMSEQEHDDGKSISSCENPQLKKEGCSCKKSRCLKFYCVCYSAGLHCSKTCSCKGCANKIYKRSHGKSSLTIFRSLSKRISFCF